MKVRDVRHSFLALAALTGLMTACSAGGGDAMASSGDGQVVSLGEPTGEFPEDFGAIQTVRELDDGNVLVADPLGGALYRVDFETGQRSQVGSEGQGPEEYRQPDAVWRLPGDSTLLVDLGNGRMTALAPDLSFGETSPLSAGDPRTGMIVAIPRAVDDAGRVYARSLGFGMGAEPPDSGAILRVTRGSLEVDTVGTFKVQDQTVERSGTADNQSVSVSPVPLSKEDAWGAAPDGSVVIARSLNYTVEWHALDGSVTMGSPTPYDVIPIGTAEKEEFLRAQGQSGGGLGISISMGPAGMEMGFSRGGGDNDESINDYTWPESKPPFYSGRVPVDPMNHAWVQRHVRAGNPATYDVFDGTGERIASYELPFGSQVVGFGAESVYVVIADEFDLNYLKRYAMPSM